MSESDAPVKTPSENLSEKIVAILSEKQLLLSGDAKRISSNLAIGKLKAEDWRVMIEKAMDKEASNE